MGNPNYIKGRRKEYKIRNKLLSENWDIVQRTAGSHSPIDIIAIDINRKIIKLIQAKPEKYNAEKILKKWEKLNDDFRVEFEVC